MNLMVEIFLSVLGWRHPGILLEGLVEDHLVVKAHLHADIQDGFL